MKKKLFMGLMMSMCFIVGLSMQAAAKKATNTEGKKWSPVALCVWPGVARIPDNQDIYGLNFGLATFGEKGTKVVGVDFGPLISITNNVEGVSFSLCNVSDYAKGAEIGIGLEATHFNGLQLAPIVSIAADSGTVWQVGGLGQDIYNAKYAVQIGFWNKSDKSHGIQIGLINYMDNGFLPVFPLFNFSV